MKYYIRVFIALLLLLSSCKERESGERDFAMASYENTIKNTFKTFIEYGWNNGNMDSLREAVAENYEKHLNGIQIASNPSEMEANMNIYFKGFPDGMVAVENVQTNKNRLFANWIYTGTNTGIFGEFPPTGKKVTVRGHTTVKFDADGKIISENVYYNELELLQQLGYTLNPPVLE